MAFVCVYKTGGTDNGEWKPAIPVSTLEEAIKQAIDLKKMGYCTIVEKVK